MPTSLINTPKRLKTFLIKIVPATITANQKRTKVQTFIDNTIAIRGERNAIGARNKMCLTVTRYGE